MTETRDKKKKQHDKNKHSVSGFLIVLLWHALLHLPHKIIADASEIPGSSPRSRINNASVKTGATS